MTRFCRLIALTLIVATTAIAAAAAPPADGRRARDNDREQWFAQLRQFKHEYFTKELGLTAEQQTRFFALYDAMDAERRGLKRAVRKAEKTLKEKGKSATDADYEKVSKEVYSMKGQINDIEMKYYEQFKTVLTTKQLYQLKEVEDNFSQLLRKYYREHSKKKSR